MYRILIENRRIKLKCILHWDTVGSALYGQLLRKTLQQTYVISQIFLTCEM